MPENTDVNTKPNLQNLTRLTAKRLYEVFDINPNLLTDQELFHLEANAKIALDALAEGSIHDRDLRAIFASKQDTRSFADMNTRDFEIKELIMSLKYPLPLRKQLPVEYFNIALEIRKMMKPDERKLYNIIEIYDVVIDLIEESIVNPAA